MAVSAIVNGSLKALGVIRNTEFGAGIAEMFGPGKEAYDNNGENVVSKGLDAVISGMDALGDNVANVRDSVGKGVHDAVSKVPLIGGLLGAATDAVGVVVDAGGAVYSEVVATVGSLQSISNIAGSKFFGAKYVESDAEAVKGLSDEQKQDMSVTEIMRSEGVIGGAVSVVGKGLGAVKDAVFGKDESESSSLSDSDTPAWFGSLESAYAEGRVSDAQASEIVRSYEAGVVTDDLLNEYATDVDAGSCNWSQLGTNLATLEKNVAVSGTQGSMMSADSALASMEASANASVVEAEPQSSVMSPQFDSNGLAL